MDAALKAMKDSGDPMQSRGCRKSVIFQLENLLVRSSFFYYVHVEIGYIYCRNNWHLFYLLKPFISTRKNTGFHAAGG
jgi:hypothetical protein